MSTITEAAELEAAITEAELEEAEAELVKASVAEGVPVAEAVKLVLEERDDEGSGVPAEEPNESGEPSKRQLSQLDRENARHEKRVREIMGELVDGFVPCEPCAGAGMVPPGPPPPEPQEHPWFRACGTCEGFGKVLTGSLDPNHSSRDCPACKGRGYLEAIGADGTALAEQTSAAAPAIAAPALVPPDPAPQANGQAAAELTFGTPAWMGDPKIGA